MSEFDGIGDPDHVCDEACGPYVPLEERDLEGLNESDHIDALYDLLDRTREHAALLLLALQRAGSQVCIPARSAAFLLDLDQEVLGEVLRGQPGFTPEGLVDLSVALDGEDGYVGEAMAALFRLELDHGQPPS